MAKKKGSKILLIILVVIAALLVSRNVLIKFATEKSVGVVTGLPLKIGSFNVGLFKTAIDIKDFKLYNPASYQDRVMVNIPEIYVDYKLLPIFAGKVHLEEMRFHLSEFTVVKNKDGSTNLDTLKALQKPKKEEEKKEKKGKAAELQVDNLSLKVDRVVFKDYSKEGEPKVKEFNIGLNEKHENIRSLTAVVSLIVFKTLTKTTIASLTNFDLEGLGSTLSGTLSSTTEAAGKIVGETTDQTKKAITGTTEKLKDTTESLKGIFKKPFGND